MILTLFDVEQGLFGKRREVKVLQQKKIPMRKCIGCMDSKPKRELLRIVRTPEGQLKVDLTGKMNGRGAYLCKDPSCFDKMVKGRKLNREFEMEIEDSMYQEMKDSFNHTQQTSGGGAIG